MYNLFKRRVFGLLVVFISLFTLIVRANRNDFGEEQDKKALCKNKNIESIFPDWLSDRLLHEHIPFSVNLMDSDYLFSNLIYADTIFQKIDVVTYFTLTKKGKINNCVVENLQDTTVADEIKRIISISGKWKANVKAGKKVTSEQRFTIPLALNGSMIVLDEGPGWGELDKRINGKRYNLTRYIHQVAMHIYNKCDDKVEKFEYPELIKFPILGTLKFSFIINKEGYFSNLKYIDNLSHIQLASFMRGQMFPGRLFSHEVKWAPAILNGKPVSVQVEAVIDYDKKEFSWDCFLINEKRD
ncbi:hypothetical protein [uncultured Sanguibacteroides sp.]|nr:hypothetical protein [uncultured Sanguibacteroides sp.]